MLSRSRFCFIRSSTSQNIAASSSSSSSVKNTKQLTHLRHLFGYYHSTPCEFKGSPAMPYGSNHHVRYESLDINDIENIKKAAHLAATSSESTQKRHLHRIHHIGGFISSLFVAEYRTYHPLHPTSAAMLKNDEHHNFERELFLLDCGIPTDITRMEVALRHVFHDDCVLSHHNQENVSTNEGKGGKTPIHRRRPSIPLTKKNPDFIAEKMKLVFATHAHVDHLGSAFEWISRGVPVATVPNLEEHWHGLMGKLQWIVEVLGSNFYASYLNRKFPEFTWINPFKKVPQVSDHPQLFGDHTEAQIPNNRMIGGNEVPIFSDWVVLQVPGHTHHMGILYHPSSRMIYVADMFLHQFGKFRPPIPVDRLDCYLKSLDMIKKLPVRWVLLAHGGIMRVREEGEPLNQELVAQAERRQQHKEMKNNKLKEVPVEGEEKEHTTSELSQEDDIEGKKKEYGKNEKSAIALAMENEKNETFKEICESVAARAIKTSKNENANSSLIVKVSRIFANSSNAPKIFDWDRDMMPPEEQMEIVMKRLDFGKNIDGDRSFAGMKHVRDYTIESQPRD